VPSACSGNRENLDTTAVPSACSGNRENCESISSSDQDKKNHYLRIQITQKNIPRCWWTKRENVKFFS
jgi:hypothetical protein